MSPLDTNRYEPRITGYAPGEIPFISYIQREDGNAYANAFVKLQLPPPEGVEKTFFSGILDLGYIRDEDFLSVVAGKTPKDVINPVLWQRLQDGESFRCRIGTKVACRFADFSGIPDPPENVEVVFMSNADFQNLCELRRTGKTGSNKPASRLRGLALVFLATEAVLFGGLGLDRKYNNSGVERSISAVVGNVARRISLLTKSEPVDGNNGKPHPDSKDKDACEEKEAIREQTPFEVVLDNSTPILLSDTLTYRDNILDPSAVSRHFLGGRFVYRGNKTEMDYYGKKSPVHRFAMIGEKSGFSLKGGEGKDLWKSTTSADTVNTLLDTENLSEEQIKDWLVWIYSQVFRVDLEKNGIKIEMKNGKVLSIKYNPPNGFDDGVYVDVVQPMIGIQSTQPGGNASKRKERQKILSKDNTLLIPSGVSPTTDLIVPVSLMKRNPSFTLNLRGFGEWKLTAEAVARKITDFLEREKNAKGNSGSTKVFGKDITFNLIGPLILKDDPAMSLLANFLLKNIPANDHRARIKRLIEFVQSYPYVFEYDTDRSRPGFVTLFNAGADCNNGAVPFAELMLAAGYDVSLFRVANRDALFRGDTLHVMGGVPAKYFPEIQNQGYFFNNAQDEKWLPIELRLPPDGYKFAPGRASLMNTANTTAFDLEILRTPKHDGQKAKTTNNSNQQSQPTFISPQYRERDTRLNGRDILKRDRRR